MQCRICGNSENNKSFSIIERQHGTREVFPYFQCSACDCIQIENIPEDLSRFYPSSYYSFNQEEGKAFLEKQPGFFKRVQAEYLIHGKRPVLGWLFTLGYPSHRLFNWLRELRLPRQARILDIGCGNGMVLKQFYQLGYRQLTGVDPFIPGDYVFTGQFRIYKKDPLELDPAQPFDCIMMHHSFEHMVHEKEVLRKARQLLTDGGKLLIRIPVYSKALMLRYHTNLVSLDAPRHIYIHSEKSMEILCREAGLQIDKVEYDADAFSLWASEQYARDICLSDERSYSRSRDKSVFNRKQIKTFKKEIATLNRQGKSDNAAFYITKK